MTGRQAGVAVGVDVDPPRHRAADVLLRRGVSDAGRVVVDEVALEVLDLLVGQDDLGELPDPRVDAVHDLVGVDLLLEHRAAGADPLEGLRGELHLLAVPGDADEVRDRQRRAVQDDGHSTTPLAPARSPPAGPSGIMRRAREELAAAVSGSRKCLGLRASAPQRAALRGTSGRTLR